MAPALHPQAKFDPIPPDLDLNALVKKNPNFSWVLRISTAQIRNLSQQEFENLVNIHVIQQGRPLVISGWGGSFPKDLFSAAWLEGAYDKNQENVRDINTASDIPMTLGHYLRSMRQLANQWTPTNFRDERRQRLYLKDIDCPPEWHAALRKIMPPNLFYLNENVTDRGDQDAENPDRDGDIFRSKVQSAPAGDLMSCLPEEMRAQNLMCYIGHEGTYTAAHREMCASLGQNIMVEASGSENGEKPGSSIWFMTETNDREVVREYFLSMLGHDIEIEKHFAQINAWKKATFPVYVVDQKPGDFILIPPLAAHQVWNRGTRTMKVAWNRTTVETLELAMKEALPKARLVCRDEQYKNKAIVYYALQKYAAELETEEHNDDAGLLGLDPDLIRTSSRTQQLAADFKRLFRIFSDILTDEMFATKEKEVEMIPFDSCITCSYCRSNIFNRFLTCKHCIRPLLDGDQDTYDVCMECYAMGRSCLCISGLQWCEQWEWSELVDNHERWGRMIIKNDGFVDMENSPLPVEIARRRRGKRSLAQVCQESLKRRPFKDITKPLPQKPESESEPEVDDEGRIKKKRRKRKRKQGDTRRCHVCCHKDYAYKVHVCSNPTCSEGYCYGVLYRAFDMMPQSVMESEYWKCPKCLGICNCGACRRAGTTTPYTPKSTSLGHDTRPIADDRSVEALVDFRIHNLSWLKAAGEESRSKNSRRMQRLREQADVAKSQEQANQTAADENAHAATNHAATNGTTTGPTTNGHGLETNGTDTGAAATNGHDGGTEEPLGPTLPLDHPMAPLEASLREEQVDVEAYPDPMHDSTMSLAQHLIGMGYYEQDDSPDKILFDPYEMPTAESMVFDEPEVPEYLKKSIRAAKRKARQANEEDPDFAVSGRQNKKKQRREHFPEDFELDPALFGTPSGKAASADAASGEGPATEGAGAGGDQAAVEEEITRPSLRGAKPKQSYAETDDIDAMIDDPDNIVPHWSAKQPRVAAPLAAEQPADRSESQSSGVSEGSPVRSLFSAPAMGSAPPKRRPGRPPKSRLEIVVLAEDVTPETDAEGSGSLDDELQTPARDLEKELTRDEESADASAAADADTVSQAKRGPGRPRRSAVVEYREVEEGADEEPAEPKPKRGPGRPRRSTPLEYRGVKKGEASEPKPKRGPGRPRRSTAAVEKEPADEQDDSQGDGATAESKPLRGRGCPRRSVPAYFEQPLSDEEEEEEEETPEPKPKRGPGRPRRTAAPLEDLDVDFRPGPASRRTSMTRGGGPVKRGRGRPRRSEVTRRAPTASPSPPPEEEEEEDAVPKSVKMMSMAERMRMKGRKFRIASRKPDGGLVTSGASSSAASSPARLDQINVSRGTPGGDSSESPGSVRAKAWTVAGRTVVKLGDVLSETGESSSSSSEGDSGDEIPARIGPVRGRGRGRGRPRGRGRGRARAV